MKDNKGFTLIELLAVIVILAIIALIATPIILDVIETAKRGSKESSVLGFVDSVGKQIAVSKVDKTKNNLDDGVYTVDELTNDYGVSVKGEKPSTGWVKIENQQVVDYSLKIEEYIIEPNGKGGASVTDKTILSPQPEDINSLPKNVTTQEVAAATEKYIAKVYLDPEDPTKTCTKADVEANVNANGTPTGIKNGCMLWYAYKDDGTNYKMILDHNTTPLIAYNSTNSNSAPKEYKKAFDRDVSTWNRNLKASSLTGDEVAEITGNTKYKSATTQQHDWFYIDTNSYTAPADKSQGASKYHWLFDNLRESTINGGSVSDDYEYNCDSAGYYCDSTEYKNYTYGYWIETPVAYHTMLVWTINNCARFRDEGARNDNIYGIRPVITIPKTMLKVS